MTEPKDYPSLPEQARNLAQFSFEVVKDVVGNSGASKLYATDAVFDQRLDTCKTCEYYDEKQVRCRHCGCWLKYKARFKEGHCPIGKW